LPVNLCLEISRFCANWRRDGLRQTGGPQIPRRVDFGGMFQYSRAQSARVTDRRLLAKSGVAPNSRQSRPRRTAPGVV
jgi:hypothetical protein